MNKVTDQKLIDLVQSIKEVCAGIVNDKDLEKVLKGNKTAAVRFRQKTHNVAKLFKEFRQQSIKCGLVYTHKDDEEDLTPAA